MPYIAKRYREAILRSPVGDLVLSDPRELQFAIMTLVVSFTKDDESRLNEALGALLSVQQELYRKRIAPTMEQSLFDNGDIT